MKPDTAERQSSIDLVIEAFVDGIDLTLIRENLRRTPEERLRALQELQRLSEELRRAGETLRQS